MNEKMDIQNKHEDLKRSLNQSEEEAEITRDKLAKSEKTIQKLLDGKFAVLKFFEVSVFRPTFCEYDHEPKITHLLKNKLF